MSRYIDADILKDDLIHNRSFYPAIVSAAIKNTPTADVLVLPCKVRDEIYALSASETQVHTYIVTRLEILADGIKIYARHKYCHSEHWMCWADDLGNNNWVFLTKEEAEKALAERKEDGEIKHIQ